MMPPTHGPPSLACHVFSYLVGMVPLSWFLALPGGLLEGVLIASILSLLLLGGRFHWLTMQDKRTFSV
jgi:heme O synthase-like polyprenyltransferase